MANPITWRNVNGPDFSGGNLISSGVSDIQSGLAGLQNILGTQARQEQETWQRVKEANTLNALNQVNQIGSVEQLDSTQASDLINPYGAQVNAQAVMDALKGQRGVIADDMQTEDSINSYTEKVKYGAIADQAALLIQQGKIKEAAPLLEQLKGTSFAGKLGGMVQQVDWHNQEIDLKNQELGLQRARINAENRRYTEAENEDNLANQAAAEVDDLVTNKGMLPNDAVSLVARKYGPKMGTDIGRLVPILTGYASAAFQLPEGARNQLAKTQGKLETVLASGEAQMKQQQIALAQKTGYDPTLQAQWDKYNLEKNSFIVGNEDGQMSPADKDKLDTELRLAGQPPLSTGETVWLVKNKQSSLGGYRNPYALDTVIKQRDAKKAYDERNSVLTSDYSTWETETKKQVADQQRIAIGHAFSPNLYKGGEGALDKANVMLDGRVGALNGVIGKTVGLVDENAQQKQQIEDLKAQKNAAVNQLGQASSEVARLNQNGAGHPSGQFPTSRAYSTSYSEAQNSYNDYLAKQAEERRINAPKKEWATNYTPKTSKDWDMVQQALTADIQQSDSYPTMKLRALNDAIERAKNGDDRVFKAYFKDRLEKYAETIYPGQKAGKK